MWSKWMKFTPENIKTVPNVEGDYEYRDKNGNLLYIGVSDKRNYSGLRHRVESYHEKDDPNVHPTKVKLRKHIDSFRWKAEPIDQARQEEHDVKQDLPFNMDSHANEMLKRQ